jgi:hypothetical protein
MRRLSPALLLALPVTVVAWLGAHELAYGLAFSGEHARTHALAASGHGYLEHAPLLVALCLTVAAGGFVARALGRPSGSRTLPTAGFAALPLFGFALQEHLERLLNGAPDPWGTGLEPVFLIGLALQLPFGLAAGLLARALAAAADELGAALAPFRLGLRPAGVLVPADEADLVPAPVLATRGAGRAPPARL